MATKMFGSHCGVTLVESCCQDSKHFLFKLAEILVDHI